MMPQDVDFSHLKQFTSMFSKNYAGPSTLLLEHQVRDLDGRQDDFCLICLEKKSTDQLYPQMSEDRVHYCPRRFCTSCYMVENQQECRSQHVTEDLRRQYSRLKTQVCPLCQKRSWDIVSPLLGVGNPRWNTESKKREVQKDRQQAWVAALEGAHSWRKDLLNEADDMTFDCDRQLILKIGKASRSRLMVQNLVPPLRGLLPKSALVNPVYKLDFEAEFDAICSWQAKMRVFMVPYRMSPSVERSLSVSSSPSFRENKRPRLDTGTPRPAHDNADDLVVSVGPFPRHQSMPQFCGAQSKQKDDSQIIHKDFNFEFVEHTIDVNAVRPNENIDCPSAAQCVTLRYGLDKSAAIESILAQPPSPLVEVEDDDTANRVSITPSHHQERATSTGQHGSCLLDKQIGPSLEAHNNDHDVGRSQSRATPVEGTTSEISLVPTQRAPRSESFRPGEANSAVIVTTTSAVSFTPSSPSIPRSTHVQSAQATRAQPPRAAPLSQSRDNGLQTGNCGSVQNIVHDSVPNSVIREHFYSSRASLWATFQQQLDKVSEQEVQKVISDNEASKKSLQLSISSWRTKCEEEKQRANAQYTELQEALEERNAKCAQVVELTNKIQRMNRQAEAKIIEIQRLTAIGATTQAVTEELKTENAALKARIVTVEAEAKNVVQQNAELVREAEENREVNDLARQIAKCVEKKPQAASTRRRNR